MAVAPAKIPAQLSELEQFVSYKLTNDEPITRLQAEKKADALGLSKLQAKEMIEFAVAKMAIKTAQNTKVDIKQRYDAVVRLYEAQPNLSLRTSTSTMLQQYSTPPPLAFVASQYVYSGPTAHYFEPSAGNGLLTMSWPPANTFVNEISPQRLDNLRQMGYHHVFDHDASKDFQTGNYGRVFSNAKFDGIATNPPFGSITPVMIDGLKFSKLEHLMARNALMMLKEDGKAAVIIGGHLEWDAKGVVKAGANRVFYAWLYRNFNIEASLNINGKKLYSKMGTGFPVRLILINGSAPKPLLPPRKQDLPPCETQNIDTWQQLWECMHPFLTPKSNTMDILEIEAMAELELMAMRTRGLGAPYSPASVACSVLDVSTPDSMAAETHARLHALKQEIGDITEFVRLKLNYATKSDLCNGLAAGQTDGKGLAAEQIDAVALAIHNIERKNTGMIIGDQTGIGKGRTAAALIRYAHYNGLLPIFITEKSNLFSDIYRDLIDIDFSDIKPFVVNTKESKTNITIGKEILFTAPEPALQKSIIASGKLPAEYQLIMATYSQFNSESTTAKRRFISHQAKNALIILDEAHNAGGQSQTGDFFKDLVKNAAATIFLSATFAKRPDNMPLYALKTSMRDAALTDEDLVEAITKGGVALQEVLSAQLVAEGQMIRRERTFDNIKVEYIVLDNLAKQHEATANNITAIVRDIIAFEKEYIDAFIENLDKAATADLTDVHKRKGTKTAGVDNTPFFSKVFNLINQMLFSIKADAVADRAIERLRKGYKPVIAFSSTMEAFISEYATEEIIRTDFSEVLHRALQNTLKYTTKDVNGEGTPGMIDITEMPKEAQDAFMSIAHKISTVSAGISISPIDAIVQRIEAAGYSVAEVTGRSRRIALDGKGNGQILTKTPYKVDQAFFDFNNNTVDVLMINQSGSTGASAHAHLPKGATITKEDIKPRVMIVLQAEVLNINTEVQKRGRINRTGQILLPEYDYVSSAIPAEKRLMMMLQKKLKSLDANTSGSQTNSATVFSADDFLNKYGDDVVLEYLWENPEINELLGDPLKLEDKNEKPESADANAAHRVSGRVAILTTEQQRNFYDEIKERYEKYVRKLIQKGEYDLEVETMELQATTIDKDIAIAGRGGSRFGTHTYLERCEVNNLSKPYTAAEVENILQEALGGKTPEQAQQQLLDKLEAYRTQKKEDAMALIKVRWDNAENKIKDEKAYKAAAKEGEGDAYYQQRLAALKEGRESDISLQNDRIDAQTGYLRKLFRSLQIGQNLYYPMNAYGQGTVNVPAIFIGFGISDKKPNPLAPSAVDISFAVANSIKQLDYIATPKDQQEVLAILGASQGLNGAGLGNAWKWRAIAAKRKEREANKSNLVVVKMGTETVSVKSDYNRDWIDWVKEHVSGRKWNSVLEHWEWPISSNKPDTAAIEQPFMDALKKHYPNDRIEVLFGDNSPIVAQYSASENAQTKPEPEPEPEIEPNSENFLANWDELTKASARNRVVRYIATGNLLQAAGNFSGGRLIDFSRDTGQTDKGLLLPISYEPGAGGGKGFRHRVSLMQALPVVRNLGHGAMLMLSNSMSIGKSGGEQWSLMVPSNKKSVYQHPDLMAWSQRGEFYKTGNNFVATYSEENLEKVAKLLTDEFGVNAELTPAQFERIADTISVIEVEELAPAPPAPAVRPDPVVDVVDMDMEILELEAAAELELIEIRNRQAT
jgi:hypothetical protein